MLRRVVLQDVHTLNRVDHTDDDQSLIPVFIDQAGTTDLDFLDVPEAITGGVRVAQGLGGGTRVPGLSQTISVEG